jgi:hypothetical protein
MSRTRLRLYLLPCVLFGIPPSGGSGKTDQKVDAYLKLKDLCLEHTQIVSADYHSEGHDVSWKSILIGIPWFDVPASCRVKFILTPGPIGKESGRLVAGQYNNDLKLC